MNIILAQRCQASLWLVLLSFVIATQGTAQDEKTGAQPGSSSVRKIVADDKGESSPVDNRGADIAGQANDKDSIPGGLGGGFGGGLGGLNFGGGVDINGTNRRMVQEANVIISWSKDLDELRGFSQKTGEWALLKIEKQTALIPVVGGDVAAVRFGDRMAAYSATTGSWDTLQLSPGSKAVPVVGPAVVQTTDNDRFYTFAAAKGEWTSPNDPNLRRSTNVNPSARRAGTSPSVLRTRIPSREAAGTVGGSAAAMLDQQALKLARKFRGQGLDDPEARRELSQAVAQAFDSRQAYQSAEARRMKEKLEKIQAAIASRASLRERIVARRVDELLDPNIDWDSDASDLTRHSRNGQQPQAIFSPAKIQASGTASGLPGPPHNPVSPMPVSPGGLSAPSRLAGSSTDFGNLPPTGRFFYDHNQALAERRREAEAAHERRKANAMHLKESQQPLAEVKKRYRSMTEEERQSRVSAFTAEGELLQQQFVQCMAQWKQEWSRFESQIELLKLDLEEAEVKKAGAAVKLVAVEKLRAAVSTSVTSAKLQEAKIDLDLADIAVKRAQRMLTPYLKMQKELDFLNPNSFKPALPLSKSAQSESSGR